jgi:hypothetical protein
MLFLLKTLLRHYDSLFPRLLARVIFTCAPGAVVGFFLARIARGPSSSSPPPLPPLPPSFLFRFTPPPVPPVPPAMSFPSFPSFTSTSTSTGTSTGTSTTLATFLGLPRGLPRPRFYCFEKNVRQSCQSDHTYVQQDKNIEKKY